MLHASPPYPHTPSASSQPSSSSSQHNQLPSSVPLTSFIAHHLDGDVQDTSPGANVQGAQYQFQQAEDSSYTVPFQPTAADIQWAEDVYDQVGAGYETFLADDSSESSTADDDEAGELGEGLVPAQLGARGFGEQIAANVTGDSAVTATAPSSSIPLHFCRIPQPDENSPDPFRNATTDTPGMHRPISEFHELEPVQILYLLVAWLHSQAHVPLRILTAVLHCVGTIIILCLGRLDVSIPVTFKTVSAHMGIEPVFQILPICPNCQEVYPDSPATPDKCRLCQHELFQTGPTRSGQQRKSRGSSHKKAPYKPLSEQLAAIIAQPRVEELLDQWRSVDRKDNHYHDIFDGRVAKDVLAADGTPFFRNLETDSSGPEGELRIALTLGVDW